MLAFWNDIGDGTWRQPGALKASRAATPYKPAAAQSLFLHSMKIIAIAAVVLGHVTKPDILFDVDVSLIGRATIPTFFAISGYLTAMTVAKGADFFRTVVRRYVNLYYMFVPAAFLVLAMDLWMIQTDAAFTKTDKFDANITGWRVLVEFFYLFTFSGEYWSLSTFGQGVFSNAAMWTMDYMMAYTVATAALYTLDGWKRVLAILLVAAAAGPTVLLLAPLWFGGVVAFEVNDRSFRREQTRLAAQASFGVAVSARNRQRQAWIAVLVAFTAWMLMEYWQLGQRSYQFSKSFAPYEYRQYLGMAKRFLWQYYYVPILFTFLVASRHLYLGPVNGRFKSVIVTMSKYCFPVYAIHFTLMYFVSELMPNYQPKHTSIDPYIVLCVSLAVSILYGRLCFKFAKPFFERLSAPLLRTEPKK